MAGSGIRVTPARRPSIDAGGITPIGVLAPGLTLANLAVAVEQATPLLHRDRRGDAHAQAHLLLGAEGELVRVGGELGVEDEHGARRAGQDGYAAGLETDGRLARPRHVTVADDERSPPRPSRGWFDEPLVLNPALVSPEVDSIDVAERQPEARVHRGVVGRIGPLHRREAARHGNRAGSVELGEVGAEHRLVAKYVGGQRISTELDLEPVPGAHERHFGSIVVGPHGDRDHDQRGQPRSA